MDPVATISCSYRDGSDVLARAIRIFRMIRSRPAIAKRRHA
jgi:hypothetical protein